MSSHYCDRSLSRHLVWIMSVILYKQKHPISVPPRSALWGLDLAFITQDGSYRKRWFNFVPKVTDSGIVTFFQTMHFRPCTDRQPPIRFVLTNTSHLNKFILKLMLYWALFEFNLNPKSNQKFLCIHNLFSVFLLYETSPKSNAKLFCCITSIHIFSIPTFPKSKKTTIHYF